MIGPPPPFGPLVRQLQLRDSRYLDWVRSLPCWQCNAHAPSDPHHIVSGGVGQKCSDYWTVPLCRECHRRVEASKAEYAERMLRGALICLGAWVSALNGMIQWP